MHYGGGVLQAGACPGTRLDHAILAVGWANAGGQDYAIVKNSWGAGWGESGYIRMQISGTNIGACGVLLDPTLPYTN